MGYHFAQRARIRGCILLLLTFLHRPVFRALARVLVVTAAESGSPRGDIVGYAGHESRHCTRGERQSRDSNYSRRDRDAMPIIPK